MDFEFAKTLLGIKYTWWNEDSGDDMFYTNGIPELSTIKSIGINCAGLVNLIRQKSGLTIPELNQDDEGVVRGGTYHWYNYFLENKLLNKFDYSKYYPIGTILLRTYRDLKDQGHLAIIYSEDPEDPENPPNSIIHAYSCEIGNQVGISNLYDSHFCIPEGYYEYVVYPEDWLCV